MITEKNFLSQANTGELVFHIIMTVAAFFVTAFSIIDLKKIKKEDTKNKIILVFCVVSSLVFILSTVYRLVFMLKM